MLMGNVKDREKVLIDLQGSSATSSLRSYPIWKVSYFSSQRNYKPLKKLKALAELH